MINRAMLDLLKQRYPEGTRVELKNMVGEEDMPSGLKGTVNFVDDIGQIHVNWENGRTLALDPSVDSFSKITEQEEGIDISQSMNM